MEKAAPTCAEMEDMSEQELESLIMSKGSN